MRESNAIYFLKIAELTSSRSTCPRRKVGCIITNKHNHIVATGYNGVPRNYPHCIENPCGGEIYSKGKDLDFCMATHAEQNALLQCSDVMRIKNIYITVSPCIHCAKLIANTSCQEVFYLDQYEDIRGIILLQKLGIKCTNVRK